MILVTGATGLLGSYLISALLKRGEKVRALRRSSTDMRMLQKVLSYQSENPEALFSAIEWLEGDVCDVYSLEEAMKGISQVYHCAGIVSFEPRFREMMMNTNVRGTANVVNAALHCGIDKLCHVSSVAALSRTEADEVIDENSTWKPSGHNSVYAVSKYNGEREVWRGMEEGLNAVIVNPSIIIGYAGNNSGSSQLFSTIDACSWFYSNGVNGFIDVRDVASCMITLTNSDISGKRFVLSAENLSYRQLFIFIAAQLEKKLPFIRAGNGLLSLVWRIEKLRSLLLRSQPMITMETVNTQKNRYFYNNNAIKQATGINFIPIEESISYFCSKYSADKPWFHCRE